MIEKDKTAIKEIKVSFFVAIESYNKRSLIYWELCSIERKYGFSEGRMKRVGSNGDVEFH